MPNVAYVAYVAPKLHRSCICNLNSNFTHHFVKIFDNQGLDMTYYIYVNYTIVWKRPLQNRYLFNHAERWSVAKRPDSSSIPTSCFRPLYGPCKLAIRPFGSATFLILKAWILFCPLYTILWFLIDFDIATLYHQQIESICVKGLHYHELYWHKVEVCLMLNDSD